MAEYALLHIELVRRFLPQDRMEMAIVERIIQSIWRQRRVQYAMHALHEMTAAQMIGKYRKELEDGAYDEDYVNPDKITTEQQARRATQLTAMTATLRHPAITYSVTLGVDEGKMDRLVKYEQRLEGTIRNAMKDLKLLRECKQFRTGEDANHSLATVLRISPFLPALEQESMEEDGIEDDELDRLQNEPTDADLAGETTGSEPLDVQNEPTIEPEDPVAAHAGERSIPDPAAVPAMIALANLPPQNVLPDQLCDQETLEFINEWQDAKLRKLGYDVPND